MQINISGHHVEVTPALHDYVMSKLDRLTRRLDNITTIHVTLSVEKQRQMAEANIHATGVDFVATSENEDMYAAIDLMIDKMDRQLCKHKEKMISRQHGS